MLDKHFLVRYYNLQEVLIMKGRDIVKSIMKQKKVTNADMAARLQITQAALWDRLNTKKTKDIPSSTLTEMLRPLDYKLVVVPRNTRLPADSFEIEWERDGVNMGDFKIIYKILRMLDKHKGDETFEYGSISA